MIFYEYLKSLTHKIIEKRHNRRDIRGQNK